MDIQRWLATTTDGPPPQPSDDRHLIPDAFRAHPQFPGGGHPLGRSYRRKKRSRASSDSSLIAPRRPDRGLGQLAACSLPSVPAQSAQSSGQVSDGSACSSTRASLSPEHAQEKTYERRPRHKTRPDRYEPKRKKQKGERDARKERKSGKKRRKSHRGGDGGRTAGLVQGFQLKNGPKNSRLTMKPSTTAGLFKHGRASVQVKGRGRGLPDLVFNELRFLQRPTEHQDVAPDRADEQQRSKKDRKRPVEGDISAYFAAREATRERREGRRDAADRFQRVSDDDAQAREPRRRHHSTPPVELPSRPFLGFGSKGVQPKGKETHSGRTTSFTWSQTSEREPPLKRKRHSTAPVVETGPFSTANPAATPRDTSRMHGLKGGSIDDTRQQDLPSRRPSRHGPWRSTKREDKTALVELYQPPVRRFGRNIDASRSTTKTTSQPLPRNSIERPREGDDGRSRREDHSQDGYHTSDILEIEEDDGQAKHHKAGGYVRSAQLQTEKENQNPASSISIDRLLNDARYLATATTIQDRIATAKAFHATRYQAEREPVEPSDSMHLLPVRGEAVHNFAQNTRPLLSASERNDAAHGTRRTQMSPRKRRAFRDRPSVRHSHELETVDCPLDLEPHQLHAAEDEEMVDHGPAFRSAFLPQEPVYATLHQAEALALAPGWSAVDRGACDGQSPQVGSEVGSYWEPFELTPNKTLLTKSVSMARTLQSGRPAATVSGDGIEGMSGFWRPNKLY